MAESQPPPPPWTLIKCGWIKKYKTKKLKYFLLSKDSKGNVYLEYFDSEKKSRLPSITNQSSNNNGSRTINITDTFYIQKRVQEIKTKTEHIVDIFTRHDVFFLLFEGENDQNDWFDTLMREKIEWFKNNRNPGMPERMFEDTFDHVWQVNVKKGGLGAECNLVGLNRLCFTSGVVPNMLLMYKVEPPIKEQGKSPPKVQSLNIPLLGQGVYSERVIEIQLNQVRKLGRMEKIFHIELGRSSTVGEGSLYIEADDPTSAGSMHGITRNAMSCKPVAISQRQSHPPIAQSNIDGRRDEDSYKVDSAHTGSPTSTTPKLKILEPGQRTKDEKSGRSDSIVKKQIPTGEGDDIYVPMGPTTTVHGDVTSSVEEQGYLEMTVSKNTGSSVSSSLDHDAGYLDMSPVSSYLSGMTADHGHSSAVNAGNTSSTGHTRSRAGTSGSVRSSERRSRTGKSIFDVDPPELPSSNATDDEFVLEKVKSFLEDTGETDSITITPVRAYSIGSRPTAAREHFISRHGGHSILGGVLMESSHARGNTAGHQRVRSNTVGSRPPAFSPTSLSAASSTSSHLLSSTSKLTSSSNDHVDHMEIDYTNSSSATPSIGVRKLSQGHRARSDSKSSTSSNTSASVPVKVKESEPWEAHLPSSLALHPSPLNCGHSGVPSTAGSSTAAVPSSAAQVQSSTTATQSKSSAAQKVSSGPSAAANTDAADSSTADSSSSSSATISSSTSIAATLIGPVRPPGHFLISNHSSEAKTTSGKNHSKLSHAPVIKTSSGHSSLAAAAPAHPIGRTVSQPPSYPSLPPLLPSLPEAASGSIGSLNSLKKETSPDVQISDDGRGMTEDDTIQYTVIQFNSTVAGVSD